MPDVAADKKVVVRIFGEEYPITGVSDPAYISRIADIVDSRMKDAARVSRSQARDKVAILAALSLASELEEKSESLTSTNSSQESRLQGLLDRLDAALAD
jgi:cell division protein ZapA